MKKLIAIGLLLISCGTGVNTGEGVYTGKLVDVEWEGLFWKSCEIRQQTGMGTEHDDRCSSTDRALCERLKGYMGDTISIVYAKQSFSGCSIRSGCLIIGIKE